MGCKAFDLRFDIPPGNAAFVVPWDSTRGIEGLIYASEAANPAPGRLRGRYSKKKIKYTLLVTGQDVAIDEQLLIGNAGTNADWVTQGAQVPVVAATPVSREFKAIATDQRILVTAGGTGPTTLVFRGTVEDTADYGS